jgi:hypothetical protein
MDLDLERIALGTVVGVIGATVAPGTSRERNQKINFGKKFEHPSAIFVPPIPIEGVNLAAPTRLCTYYRLDQQAAVGWALILIAAALGSASVAAAIAGWPRAVLPKPSNAE